MRVTKLKIARDAEDAEELTNQDGVILSARVSGLLANYVAIGDEITCPIPVGVATGAEIYITKGYQSSGLNCYLYQAPIGYVTQPKLDKRNQHFVAADVQPKALGISATLLPCETLGALLSKI